MTPANYAGMRTADFDRQHLWHYRAQLLRVIDGDTFTALVDTGFRGRHEVAIRVADYSAPELHTPEGREAREQLIAAFQAAFPPPQFDWNLRIVTRQRITKADESRTFERYVADTYLVDRRVGMLRELLGQIAATQAEQAG